MRTSGGNSPRSWEKGQHIQSRILSETAHDIHVLDCLSGASLYEVVDGGVENNPVCPLVNNQPDATEICDAHGRNIRQRPLAASGHEFLISIKITVNPEQFRCVCPFLKPRVDCAENAPAHRQEMGSKRNGDALAGQNCQFLFYFRGMPVTTHVIGIESL